MTALTAPRRLQPSEGPLNSLVYAAPVKTSEVVYRGSFVAKDLSTGEWTVNIGTNPLVILYGVPHVGDDWDSMTGDGSKELQVTPGCITLPNFGLSIDDEGKTVFAVDNATASLDSNGGTRPVLGRVEHVAVDANGNEWVAIQVHPYLSQLLTFQIYSGGGAAYLHPPVADTTELAAIPAMFRADGMLCVTADTGDVWEFDAGSSAPADDWTVVPDAGTGRWDRRAPSLADLASTGPGKGASTIGVEDSGGLFTGDTVEECLAEAKALIDAGMQVQKRTLTATHITITAAAAFEALNIGAVLPANSRIVGVDIHTLTPFSGGAVADFTVDIGTAGDDDALIDGADLFAAAVDGGPATMPQGVRPNKFFAAGGQLTATVRCGSDDVGDATAGAFTVDITFVVLP